MLVLGTWCTGAWYLCLMLGIGDWYLVHWCFVYWCLVHWCFVLVLGALVLGTLVLGTSACLPLNVGHKWSPSASAAAHFNIPTPPASH